MQSPRAYLLAALAGIAVAAIAFAGPADAESYDSSDEPITVAPSSGGSVFVPGGDITVSGNGFGAGTPVNGIMRSDPVFLGTLVADTAGVVSGTFTVPADAPVGDHHIDLRGTDPSGNPRVLSYAITVAAAPPAADDTGAPDALSFTGSTAVPVALAGAVLTGLGVTALRFRNRRLGTVA